MPRRIGPPEVEAQSEAGDELAREYERLLQLHLVSLLHGGPLSFCQLVYHAGGAFPTDVQSALATLVAIGEIIESGGYYSLRSLGKQPFALAGSLLQESMIREEEQTAVHASGLTQCIFADPHPADYDWRFTWASLAKLSRLLEAPIKHGARIASLGAPSLYLFLARQGTKVTLFDRSHSAISDLRGAGFTEALIEHDLFYPIPDKRLVFDVVMADPPWYPEFYRAFVLRASELLSDQGVMLLSVLPWLTRPSASQDRAEVLSFAGRMGFDLIQAIPRFLSYETPTFEKAALGRRGIDCGDWRKGDIFLLRHSKSRAPVLAEGPTLEEPEWDEFRFGTLKVKLRRRGEKTSQRFAARPIGGDVPILDTVSRRWPFRSAIDLWTSRNAAYSVEGLEPLRAALKMLEEGRDPEQVAHRVVLEHSLATEDEQTLVDLLRQLKRQMLEP